MILPKPGHQNKVRLATLLAISFLLLSQASCKPNRSRERIIVASSGRITSLDPAQANTFHTLQLISALGDTLYRIDINGDLQPWLAKEKPQISDDGLTISIPLKEGIFFHDGTRFNSEAMAFSIKRFMQIGTLNYVLGGRISSVEAPDPYLIRLKLKRPSSSLRGLLTSINLTPVSPKAYRSHKEKFLNEKFVGTGPYKLQSFRNQQQRLVPFPLYWNTYPQNSGIDFISLKNSTSLYGALLSGEIDVLLSTSIDEDQRRSLNKIAVEGYLNEGEGSAMEIGYITFRSNVSPLKNIVLRKALLHSLGRKQISNRVSYGLREPLRALIPPSLKDKKTTPWPSYNPKVAKDLMKKEGYCYNKKLEIPVTFRSNVPADKLMALTWQAQVKRDLSDCLQLKLNGVESTTVYRQLGEGAFEAVILDWRGAYPDPEAYLSPLLSCNKSKGMVCEEGEAAMSGSFWTEPLLEKKLRQSDELSGTKRRKKLNQIEELAANGAAYLPVWLVRPRAWAQTHLAKPEFDRNGHLLMERLRQVKE